MERSAAMGKLESTRIPKAALDLTIARIYYILSEEDSYEEIATY